MDFRVLGQLEVVEGGTTVPLGGRKQRAVLALLILHAPEPVSAGRLVDEIWGERPPLTAQHALRVYVSAIRKVLREASDGDDRESLQTRPAGYVLDVGSERIDARRFERLLEQARHRLARDPREAIRLLEEALMFWRGAPLAEFSELEFVRQEADRLAELRSVAVECLAEARLACDEHTEVVSVLRGLVAESPLRERPRLLLMTALYRSGRHADALATYRDACGALDEIGLRPGPHLRELEQAILRHDESLGSPAPAGDVPADAAEATTAQHPLRSRTDTNLPAAANVLIGRRDELSAALAMLARGDVRLVSLLGPGGSGKTRLALEIASEMVARYRDGVCFVSLAPLADPALVASEIARALGLREAEGQPLPVTLTRALKRSELLLVLDNFEHLMPAAGLVRQLQDAAPCLMVLVTSRHALRLSGEFRIEVPPLPLTDATELFLERAQAVGLDCTDSVDEHEAVERICVRLDRLPLALELAAARVKLFSLQALAARLEQRLELPAGPRDLPDRQRTLRATIDWSYQLLTSSEQALFRGLSTFSGGARLEAIEATMTNSAPQPLETIAALVDKSLLRRSDDPDGLPRFWMLDTIREYASERLRAKGEAQIAASSHAGYFLELAERARLQIHACDQPAWLARLEADHDNLRAAFDHLVARQPADAVRMAAALGFFWEVHGHIAEGRERLERALSARCGDDVASADAMFFAGRLALLQGEGQATEVRFAEALRLARDAQALHAEVQALTHLAVLAHGRGDAPRRVELLEQALAIARAGGDDWVLRLALNNAGDLERLSGVEKADRARMLLEEGLELSRHITEPFGTALTAGNLAELALARGNLAEAESLIAESRENASKIDYRSLIGWALTLEALLALRRGELDTAAARLNEGAPLIRATQDAESGTMALAAAGTLTAARGEPLLAAQLWAAAERQRTSSGLEQDWSVALRDVWLPPARDSVDAASWEAAWQKGAQLDFHAALDLAASASATENEPGQSHDAPPDLNRVARPRAVDRD